MSTVTTESVVERAEQAAAPLMELLLSPFDELAEIDLNHDRARSLRHAEGKFFVPLFNCGFREMFRYSADYMVHPDDRERYLRELDPDELVRRFGPGEAGMVRGVFRYKLYNGEWCKVEQVNVGGKEYGLPSGVYYAFLYDVRGRETQNGKIAEGGTFDERFPAAERDALTGLLREEQFFALAKGFISERTEGWCMLSIDVESFKLFNEWYGRDQGDLILAAIGARLLRAAQDMRGLACYLGQDDFALLIPYDMAQIERLYDEIHGLVKNYGTSVGFLPAIGIGMVVVDDDTTIYDLYDRAALAGRKAKDNYHERIRIFKPAMYQQTDRDYHILSDFQKGLKDHELFIQLQPQCHISNGKVVGAESLVRWRKADGEMVSPGVFVPVLEKYGFVTDLDQYVWEEVCIWQKQWIDTGHTPLPVSVNVSQIDIYTIDVPAFFEELIKKYDLPVSVIKIEITESAYVDNEIVSDTVQRLRDKGFVVLMDDFGSGYSSLNMLRNLNVDIIKLDAQFLRMSGDDRKGVQIMESIVTMAKTMGVPIIVEGVETREESDFLAGLGCRYVQGYYFYRPMPVPDFEKLIEDPRQIDTRGFRFNAKEQFHIREFLNRRLFSDTVLNNILGPVAFYSWHDDQVDIIRYNQQFRDEIKVPSLARRMKGIQKYAVPEDIPRMTALFERAMRDPLNGADGVLRFNRPDGSITQLRVHFFFLEKNESGRKFYGSIHDLTAFITLNDHMRLLSQVNRDSVIFVCKRENKFSFHVVIHGLQSELGLSREQLQEELDDGRFYMRIGEDERNELMNVFENNLKSEKSFAFTTTITGDGDAPLRLRAKFDFVHDAASGVEYIVTLRRVAE